MFFGTVYPKNVILLLIHDKSVLLYMKVYSRCLLYICYLVVTAPLAFIFFYVTIAIIKVQYLCELLFLR